MRAVSREMSEQHQTALDHLQEAERAAAVSRRVFWGSYVPSVFTVVTPGRSAPMPEKPMQ